MSVYRYLIIFAVFLGFVFLPQNVFAETTPYRSAGWVGTQDFRENHYTNLTGCQVTDGIYCERPSAPGGMNLYFSSFGTLPDFGIPPGSTINSIHIKIRGKNSVTQWVQVGQGRNKPLGSLCQNQNKFDMWQVYLGATDSVWETHTPFTPFSTGGNGLSNCFSANTINAQNFTIALFFNGYYIDQWYAYIDNFEIAFDYTPPPSPTPTPTLTPTPTPTAVPTPEPFLDLPWEYEDFNDAALAINTYFDHSFPLLSSGLSEPTENLNDIKTYLNKYTDVGYSSHDGYDYGKKAGVNFGDSVLAAASGWATYINTCIACGNMILIDHENGYQTRYLHLQKEGLITSVPGEKIWVNNRQMIGKVGTEGNCRPKEYPGDIRCAHIHFGVFEDKNKDGSFSDNIPDGVTDPFGWQPDKDESQRDPDPWENYTFSYNGQQKTGNKSHYLWTKKLAGLHEAVDSNGKNFTVGDFEITFPQDAMRPFINLDMQYAPYANSSASLTGIGPSIEIVAKSLLGDLVTIFAEPITIQLDFADIDLSRYDLDSTTFSIYSSEDFVDWRKEPTVIDLENKTATAKVHHLTYFALMAERKDTIAPVTTAEVQGEEGQENWYRSDVSVSLNAEDNEGGLGIDYTLYKIEGEEWQEYTTPITFTTEGEHTVSFYSVDNDDNIEALQTITFIIDKTPPEAEISYSLENFDLEVLGKDGSESASLTVQPSFLHPKFIVSDKAGNTLTINTDKIKFGKQVLFSINNLQYNTNPPIDLDKQLFFTFVIPHTDETIKLIDQYYSLKGDMKIFVRYTDTTDTTTIYTKTPGVAGYAQEDRTGIALLKLSTETGTLEYSY